MQNNTRVQNSFNQRINPKNPTKYEEKFENYQRRPEISNLKEPIQSFNSQQRGFSNLVQRRNDNTYYDEIDNRRHPASNQNHYNNQSSYQNKINRLNNEGLERPVFQNYGLNDIQRDTPSSIMGGGIPSLSQPSVKSQILRDQASSLDVNIFNNRSLVNNNQDIIRGSNRSHRDISHSMNINTSVGGLNNYLNNLNNRTQIPSSTRDRDRDNATSSDIEIMRQSRARGMSNINLQSVGRIRQVETSPSQSSYSNLNNDRRGTAALNSNIKHDLLSPQSFSAQRHQNPKILETEPVVNSYRQQQEQIIGDVDMQEVLMSLNSKMKSLENKYIDLANFYKMEAIKNKQHLQQINLSSISDRNSPHRRVIGMSNTADNFYPQRNVSPLRYQNQNGIVLEEMDVVQEQNIISDLLQEKTNLDQELENIVKLQSRIQDKDQKIHEKLDTIEQEYGKIKTVFPRSQENQKQFNDQDINNLQNAIQNTISRFEQDFIKYINDNYSSFTENDILKLFQNLKNDIIRILSDNLSNLAVLASQRDSQRIQTHVSQGISNQQLSLMQKYQKDQSEFEINQEYTIQKLKKNVFDLQNKQDLTALDIKKAQMIIQTLGKAAQDLCQATSKQREMARTMQMNKNLPLGLPNMTSPRGLALTQDQLATDIQGQIKILQSSFTSINNKVQGQNQDLKSLTQIYDEFSTNLTNLKQSYTKLIDVFDKPLISIASDSINQRDTSSLPSDSHRRYNQELAELQLINNQLQDELRSTKDRLYKLQLDNQTLLTEFQQQNSFKRDKSPISLSNLRVRNDSIESNQRQANKQGTNDNNQARDYNMIRDLNQSLERKVLSLSRSLEERDREIDKLGRDLNLVSQNSNIRILQNQNTDRQLNNVSQDQLQFYQQYADAQQSKLRQLIRQTQKFLISMKKLQKAVHQKQQNVQKEKSEFEENRKELEQILKQMKREIDENQRPTDDLTKIQRRVDRLYDQNDNRVEQSQRSFMNHIGQNNQSNQVRQSIYKRQNIHQHQPSSLHQQTIYEQNSMITALNPISDISYQVMNRDKSPVIMLRNRNNLDSNNESNRMGVHQNREMFKSIEPFERGKANNMLLTSLSVERGQVQQRSPSVGDRIYGVAERERFNNHFNVNSRLQSPSQNPKTLSQQTHDIDVLLQQIRDLKTERENSNLKLMKVERDKDSYMLQVQQLEHDIERQRRILDQQREEIRDLLEEKMRLKQELDRVSIHSQDEGNFQNRLLSPKSQSNYASQGGDPGYVFELEQRVRKLDKELKETNDKAERLFEQVQLNDRITAEFKRTIAILEDSVESGRRTINDQQELIQQRNQTLAQQKIKVKEAKNQLRQGVEAVQNVGISQNDFQNIKNRFEDALNEKQEQMQARVDELNKIIDLKIQEIGKLKRQVERNIKEREIQQLNIDQQRKPEENKQDSNQVILDYQGQVQDLELSNKQLQDRIETLKNQLQQSQNQQKIQEQQLKQKDDELQELNELNQNNQEQLDREKQQIQQQLIQHKKLKDLEVQQIQQKLADQMANLLHKDQEISELKDQVKEQNEQLLESYSKQKDQQDSAPQIRRLEQNLKQAQNQIEELKSKHAQEVEDLKEQLQQDMEGLEDLNIEEQKKLKHEHKLQIEKINQQHKLELQKYKSEQNQLMNQQLQSKEEQHQIEMEERIQQLERQKQQQYQVLQDKLREKSENEKNKVREMLESKFKQELAEFTKDKDQIELLRQMHESSERDWHQQKNHLEQQIKDEQLNSKKKLQSKELELEQNRKLLQSEIKSLNSQIRENQEQQEAELQNKESIAKKTSEKLQNKINELTQAIKQREADIKILRNDIEQIQAQKIDLEHKLDQALMQNENQQRLYVQKDQENKKNQTDLKNQALQLQNIQNESMQKDQLISDLEDNVKYLEDQLAQNQTSLTTKEQQLQNSIDQLKQQVKDKASKLAESEQTTQITQNQMIKLQQDISDKDNELTRKDSLHSQQIDQLQTKLDSLNEKFIQQRDQHQAKVDDLNQTISQLEQDLEEQIDLNEEKNTQINQLQSDLDRMKREKEQLENDLQLTGQTVNEQVEKKDQEINSLRNKINELVKEKERLAEQLQKQANKSKNEASKQIREFENKIKEQSEINERANSKINDLNNQIQAIKQQAQINSDQANQNLQNLQIQNDQAKAKIEQQNLLLQQKEELIQQKQQQVKNLGDQISDLQNESSMSKILKSSLQQQIDQANQQKQDQEKVILQSQQLLQQQVRDKENENLQLQSELDELNQQLSANIQDIQNLQAKLKEALGNLNITKQQYQDLQNQNDELQEQVNTLTGTINECEQAIDQQNQTIQDYENQLEALNQHLQQAINQHQLDLNNLVEKHRSDMNAQNKSMQDAIAKKDQQIKDIIAEREQAQDQLKEMLDQTNYQKESLEGKLQSQLNQTINQLQSKERENQEINNQMQQLEQHVRDLEQQNEEYQGRIAQLQEDIEQLQNDYEEKNEMEREKYNTTLESSRNIIQALRNELQKTLDKQKQLEQQTENKSEQNDEQIQIFKQQIDKIQAQNQNLRNDFDKKAGEYQNQIDTLENELKEKNELIEEFNQMTEEINDEKHEIKAKFKHLIQILENVAEESSYKEDDDIDLEQCFERFENEFMKNQRRFESRIEDLQNDNSMLRQEAANNKEELGQIQIRMAELQAELMNALNKQDQNDIELRRKLDNASKKVQTYKDKIIEKQKVILEMEAAMKGLVELQQKNSDNQESSRSNQQKEKSDLVSKLQSAQKEILSLKQTQAQQRPEGVDKGLQDRLDQIEVQMMQLRKQIFMAKDQVIDQLSETFAKKIKDIILMYNSESILKAKLSEMKSNQQIETLNNNIKLIKAFSFGQKRLLVVQVISNNECYVIDDSKLSEVAINYLKQYLPSDDKELDSTFIHIDDQQQRILDQLQEKLIGLRDQRSKLYVQLNQIKAKITQGNQIDEKSNLQTLQLEDEVASLNKEIAELRLKNKDYMILENHLRQRLIEANEIVKSLTQDNDTNSANRKIIKLIEDNESLKQQLMSQNRKLKSSNNRAERQQNTINEDDELVEEGDFFKGIEVADNLMQAKSNTDQDEGNLFDQSSIMGVIEGINEEERKNQTQHDIRIRQLEQQVDDYQQKNQTLQNELQRSQQVSINQGDKAMFDNIKGTLIQFLRNCPLTDKNNEILLDVVFEMMEFSEIQIQDVNDKRKRAQRSGSISASGTETEEEVKKNVKKGIFGMFKKKEGSTTRKPEEQLVSPIRPIRRM